MTSRSLRTSTAAAATLAAAVAVAVPSMTAVAAPRQSAATSTATTPGPTPAPVTSGNLLTGDTATFATTTGAWVGDNATLLRTSTGALRITTVAAGWSMARSGTKTPAVAGRTYTAGFTGQAVTTSRQTIPYVTFYDAAGTKLAEVKGQLFLDAVGAWRSATPAVAIAPVGTTAAAVGVLHWATAAGEAHLVTSPTLTMTTPVGRSVVGPLSVAGNTVRDANGPLVLRGINRAGLEAGGTASVPTAAEMVEARRWGANMVRLQVAGPSYTVGDCSYSAAYAAAVDASVRAITDAGMVALFDLHTNSPVDCGRIRQQYMADTKSLAFWQQAAARWAANPLVAFDLYNEPHDVSDAVWLNGGTVTVGTTSYTAVGMQQMYDAVRGTGAKNVVVVSGNDWANRLPSTRVNGTGIVYAAHVYTCPATPTQCSANPDDPTPVLSTWAPVTTVPVVVTEFGYPSGDDGATYNRNVIAYAEAHGWGWLAFAWDGPGAGVFDLVADKGPFVPTPAGMPVVTGLARN